MTVALLFLVAFCFGLAALVRLLSSGLETADPRPLIFEKPRQDFGKHRNPLARMDCKGDFVQVDARTWQCPICKLIRFQKEAQSEA